jgi:hypothetical protein
VENVEGVGHRKPRSGKSMRLSRKHCVRLICWVRPLPDVLLELRRPFLATRKGVFVSEEMRQQILLLAQQDMGS